jgi:hypothetical protein
MIQRGVPGGDIVKWGSDLVTLHSAAPMNHDHRDGADWYYVRRVEGTGRDRAARLYAVHRADLYPVEPRRDSWRETGRRYSLDPDR